MKIVGSLFIFLLWSVAGYAQDCTPCIGINKIQVRSSINPNDTLSQLNAGTQVGLYVKIDNAAILELAPEYTRLLEFTDDKKANLLRKGEVIEGFFRDYISGNSHATKWSNGINVATSEISADKHVLTVNIESLAKPTSGAQSLYLEGQVGVYVNSEITEEVLVKNISLSTDSTTTIEVRDRKILLSYVRTDQEPVPTYVFSYSSSKPIVGLTSSASPANSEKLAANEVSISGLGNVEFMVELPKPELREIPFTLTFGLGL